jgi:hypothetical protein
LAGELERELAALLVGLAQLVGEGEELFGFIGIAADVGEGAVKHDALFDGSFLGVFEHELDESQVFVVQRGGGCGHRHGLIKSELFQLAADADGFDAGTESASGFINGGDGVVILRSPAPEIGASMEEPSPELVVIDLYFRGHAELI